MKKSVAGVFVLTFLVFGLPIGRREARAQIAPAAPPPNAPASGSAGAAHEAAAPQVAPANSGKSGKSGKTATAAASAKPHRRLPKMTFVVTATRMEQPLDTVGTTVSVVGAHQIQEQQIHASGDVLRQVPGVEVNQSGSAGAQTDVSIRGSTAAQTLILMDGVDVNSGATGGFDMADVTSDDLDRVEVVRGAGGALYGSSAIGGVVNLITREGSGPLKLSYDGEGGNRATQRQAVVFDGADGRLAYSGALSYFSTTAFRSRNASFDNLSGVARLDYHLSPDTTIHRLRAVHPLQREPGQLFQLSHARRPQRSSAQRVHALQRRRHAPVQRPAGWTDERLLRAQRSPPQRHAVPRQSLPLSAIAFPTRRAAPTWSCTTNGARDSARWPGSISKTAGCARPICTKPSRRPLNRSPRFHARRQEYAGYLEQEGRLFDGLLLLTGGVRVDGNSQFGIEVSPSWAVAIPLERWGVTLRGSYSEGFRAPSFNELYFPDFGNPNLNPEISSEYDGGITKTFGERVSFTATYFSRRVHRPDRGRAMHDIPGMHRGGERRPRRYPGRRAGAGGAIDARARASAAT